MSQDIITALRAFLLADGTVTALVGTRIFGLELPRDEAASMPRKSIVLAASGGVQFLAGSFVELASQRIDLKCYGETPFEAGLVRTAAGDALRALRRSVVSSTLIHWVEPAGGWLTSRDADADWPIAFQSHQALYALQAA